MTARRDVNWSVLALLRFFLACIVLTTHMMVPSEAGAYLNVWGGKAAVVGFMMVSGFSIAASLASRPEGFLKRRIVRIYPMYIGAVLLTVLVQECFQTDVKIDWRLFRQDNLGVIIGNALMVQMFLCRALSFNGPLWSISLEMSYYVFAPFLKSLSGTSFIPLMLISALVFVLPKDIDGSRGYQLLTTFNALRYLWSWMLGFWLYRNQNVWAVAVMGFVLPLIVFRWSAEYTGSMNLLTLVLSVACLLNSHRFKTPAAANALFDLLGDISYPLYLTHFPLRIVMVAGLGLVNEYLFYGASMVVAYTFIVVFDRWFKQSFFEPLVSAVFQWKIVGHAIKFVESR
ncbi:acyltransferase family protein [Planctomycetota bacterium]